MTQDHLLEEVFALMYLQEGTGLGMSYSEVMELDVPVKDRLLFLLNQRLEALRQAYAEAARRS